MSTRPNVGESLRLRLSDLTDIDTGAVTVADVTFRLFQKVGNTIVVEETMGATQHTGDDWYADAIPSNTGLYTATVEAVADESGAIFRSDRKVNISAWPA